MKVMEFSKDFYLEFENKFRGPRELILDRLKVYEPILKFVATLAEKPLVLDLGCGRGEFLELCNKFGIEVLGVDASEKNVELVKSLGFKAHKDDILNFLKKQESNSYNLVSLIHVVEHLEFCYVLELFKEVHRILKSGGIFIVETPYVKSPLAAFNFWVDPTHKRPIHPELLKFIGEKMGFSIIEIFPLAGKSRKDTVSLTDILYSSPDVSIILVKDTEDKYYLEKVKNVLSKVRAQASLDLEEVSLRLTQEHSSIAEEVQKLSATLAQLNQRVELTEEVSLRLTQEHSSIAEEVQKLSATLAQLNQRVELTEEVSLRLTQEHSSIAEEVQKLSATLAQLNQRVELTEEVSLRLTQEHSSIAEEVQKLSATLAQLNQRVELTEEVSLRLTQEHSSIAEEVQKLSATLAQLNQRVELTEEVSLRLTQEHSSIAEEVQKLSATLAQLNQRVELTEEVSLRLTQEHSSIAEEVQKLSATLAQLNQRVELTNKEISYVKSRLDALWNSKPWRAYQLIGKTILRISNLKGKIKSFLRSLLKNVYKRLTRYPRIYTKIKKVLDQHPNIKEKLVSLVTPENKVSSRSDERIESKSPNTIYPTDIFLKRIRRWR
jgi:SAM-dependent methyltransferase/outer membrane murein-binding lipoprotein Lpp